MRSFIESALAARKSSEEQNVAEQTPQNNESSINAGTQQYNTENTSPFASQETAPKPQQQNAYQSAPVQEEPALTPQPQQQESVSFEPQVQSMPQQEAPQQQPMTQAIQQDQAFTRPQPEQLQAAADTFTDVEDARIMVIGAGGMGNNAITRLQSMGIKGADTLAVNTDKQHLEITKADKRILIGREVTKGLGAGGYPNIGKEAAEESSSELEKALKPADLIFMIAGMGGGTGTGCSPAIAKMAKKSDTIIIGVVTMPFKIEGGRIPKAEEGLAKLRQECDTVIVIENDKLLEVAGEMPLQQAFAVADEIIVTMIKGITETIATPSIVNLDFADVKSVMKNGGVAVIGIGESSTAARSREAVEEAMSNPLLDVDFNGATGALVHIAGGPDMKLSEIGEIGDFVSKHLDPDASTIWGARVEDSMHGKIRVITIITGIKSQYILGPQELGEDDRNIGDSLGIKMV